MPPLDFSVLCPNCGIWAGCKLGADRHNRAIGDDRQAIS
jgi:hypothetical protein